jgi:hypothetical protein
MLFQNEGLRLSNAGSFRRSFIAGSRASPGETRFFFRNKFVANPVDGQKINRMSRVSLDFLPQSRDVIVHRAPAGTIPLGPDGSDQLLPRHDNLRPGYKESQHLELLQSQYHGLIRAVQLHLPEVQRDLAEARALVRSPH